MTDEYTSTDTTFTASPRRQEVAKMIAATDAPVPVADLRPVELPQDVIEAVQRELGTTDDPAHRARVLYDMTQVIVDYIGYSTGNGRNTPEHLSARQVLAVARLHAEGRWESLPDVTDDHTQIHPLIAPAIDTTHVARARGRGRHSVSWGAKREG